jgi:Bacterial protein of unknown function (DUF937)
MNLVEHIKNQLSSGVISQLSSVLGASEDTTGSAVNAAVPALLSALSAMASSGSGSQRLLSALNQLRTGAMDNLVHKLSNQPGAVHEQGTDLLNSLLGGSAISGIVNAVSRFAGIAPGTTQKLLSYITPLILGTIASKFTGKSMNAQGLVSMLADQKGNIANALPSGFSLSDVPGLAAAGSAAARSATRGVEAAGSSLTRWLLPVLGLAALGLILWWFVPSASTRAPGVQAPAAITRAQSPDTSRDLASETVTGHVPDVTRFNTELTDTFSKLTEALTSVKDTASAEVALPKLQDLEGKLDIAKTTMKELGDAGRTTIKTLVKSAQAKLKELVEKVLAIPGVGEKIKPVVDSIMAKVTELAG